MTAREWEVIDLLKAGRTTEQIAGERVLATETVRTHVKHILRELKVHLRQEAVAVADDMRHPTPRIEDPESRSP